MSRSEKKIAKDLADQKIWQDKVKALRAQRSAGLISERELADREASAFADFTCPTGWAFKTWMAIYGLIPIGCVFGWVLLFCGYYTN